MAISVMCSINKVSGSIYDMDKGPLSMIDSGIKIGSMGTNCGGGHNYTIRSYGDQVTEYRIWLEDQVKSENIPIMIELEKIFSMSQDDGGIILVTQCMPDPWITHAHVCAQFIKGLAE